MELLDSKCWFEVEYTNAVFSFSDTNDAILNLFLSSLISVGAAEVLARVDNNWGQSGLLEEVVERVNLVPVIGLLT